MAGSRGRFETCVASLCAFPAAWWLIGDLSESGGSLEYNFGRLEIDPRLELGLGAPALMIGLAALTFLVSGHSRREVSTAWLFGSLMLVAVIAAAAGCGRVLTAGTGGANLGGGIVVLFGGPILLVLFVLAVGILASDTRPADFNDRAR
jgi:hypothetical protein